MRGRESELGVKNILQQFCLKVMPGGLRSHSSENHLGSVIPAGIHSFGGRGSLHMGGDKYFHTVGWAEIP